ADDFLRDFMGGDAPLQIIKFLISVASIIPFALQIARMGMQPYEEALNQLEHAQLPSTPLDVQTLLTAFRRENIGESYLTHHLSKLGISKTKQEVLKENNFELLDLALTNQAVLRDFITPGEWLKRLQYLVYSDDDQNLLAQLIDAPLNPQDIVRIADKRVWGLQTDPKYGQYAEL